MCWEKIVIILFVLSEKSLVYGGRQERIDQQTKKFHSKVEYLVKKWSPLIYLAPGELFKPLTVEDFIKHVYPANAEGFRFNKKVPYNQNVYLKTLEDIETLKENEKSFLHGGDSQNVDAYALVKYCNKKDIDVNSTHLSKPEFFVSYWFFFPYNLGKKICFLGKVPTPSVFSTCFGKKVFMGNHVGDWEHVTLLFKGLEYPDRIFVSSHEFGAYYKYNQFLRTFIYESQVLRKKILRSIRFPKFLLNKNNHPILFSAWGSHGFWSEPGNHTYFTVPKLQDQTGFGDIWRTWQNLNIYHLSYESLPKWISFRGKWGNPRSDCILFRNLGLCKQADGPLGPRSTDFDCNSH